MNRFAFSIILLVLMTSNSFSQISFDYSLDLQPLSIPDLPGLHSYAYAQHEGKWLVIGGRKDGIHARQPFNAFPQSQNNTDIYVIDVNNLQFWTSSVNSLPAGLQEQLQSTNMNFYQDEDTLYIVGGYAFSPTSNDHITFPNLSTINVSGLINAIINGNPIQPYFKQISDPVFAVTGGHLIKLNDRFYLVGGHKFDGRYNPMGHPTYTQTYTDQIRKFSIDNSGAQLSYSNYSAITDPVHLRRRDYNLLPQIFPNGEMGLTISSGVFQIGADLPFLYPVDITETDYTPVTGFNQYLSNYHSATACFFDSDLNEMHSLFFGGMSQYYYQNGTLIQDNQVPFVKTISRLTRDANGNLQEFQLPNEMPALQGASAEFIYNLDLPHYPNEVIKLNEIDQDTILIGYIYGGILSPTLNPFSANLTNTTSADNTIYSVRLIRNNTVSGLQAIDGKNPFDITIYPNPTDGIFKVEFDLPKTTNVSYFITNSLGQIVKQGTIENTKIGNNEIHLSLDNIKNQTLIVTFVFDDKFYATKKVFMK